MLNALFSNHLQTTKTSIHTKKIAYANTRNFHRRGAEAQRNTKKKTLRLRAFAVYNFFKNYL
jgi:hypothetical protein